ncbi:MAG: hypothetical protein MUO77_08395, partial [Anaerolineales bacterium]|nr:hypothetical protein [Anaerolineales bacterium]
MKTKSQYFLALAIIIILILGSCSPAPVTNTPVPPTSTIAFTLAPTNTPILPIEIPSPENVELTTADLENGLFGDYAFIENPAGYYE